MRWARMFTSVALISFAALLALGRHVRWRLSAGCVREAGSDNCWLDKDCAHASATDRIQTLAAGS